MQSKKALEAVNKDAYQKKTDVPGGFPYKRRYDSENSSVHPSAAAASPRQAAGFDARSSANMMGSTSFTPFRTWKEKSNLTNRTSIAKCIASGVDL